MNKSFIFNVKITFRIIIPSTNKLSNYLTTNEEEK
jgi:hypothetical protein